MIYRQQVLILFLLFNYCLGLGSSIPFIGCSIRCALQCPGGYCELFSRHCICPNNRRSSQLKIEGRHGGQGRQKVENCVAHMTESLELLIWKPDCGSDPEFQGIPDEFARESVVNCMEHHLAKLPPIYHTKEGCDQAIQEIFVKCANMVQGTPPTYAKSRMMVQAAPNLGSRIVQAVPHGYWSNCYEYYIDILQEYMFLPKCGNVPKPPNIPSLSDDVIAGLRKCMKYYLVKTEPGDFVVHKHYCDTEIKVWFQNCYFFKDEWMKDESL